LGDTFFRNDAMIEDAFLGDADADFAYADAFLGDADADAISFIIFLIFK
jgi:hypothetical protein